MTSPISAPSVPASRASSRACRLLPLPDSSTASVYVMRPSARGLAGLVANIMPVVHPCQPNGANGMVGALKRGGQRVSMDGHGQHPATGADKLPANLRAAAMKYQHARVADPIEA